MAIIKTVLKKVRNQAVVKLVGDGSATIDLNSDLKVSDETFLGYANTNVHINTVFWSVPDTSATVVARNGSNLFLLLGNDNWMLTQMIGVSDKSNANANVSITIPAPGGTVLIGLTKETGYGIVNRQTLEQWQK